MKYSFDLLTFFFEIIHGIFYSRDGVTPQIRGSVDDRTRPGYPSRVTRVASPSRVPLYNS